MRFHIVSLPHTQVTDEFSACAFTEKCRKLAIMLHRMLGYEVFLYAGDQNEAPCTEHVVCFTEEERLAACNGSHYCLAPFDWRLPHWINFNNRVAAEISKRARQKDFVCLIGGSTQRVLAELLPGMMLVEFGVGYGGTFAKFRVFESYAWMHTVYGAQRADPNAVDGQWFDSVIPGYFEIERFPFNAEKDDYFLFVGRLIERKGVNVAAEACKRAGKQLIIAGQGEPPSYGEYVGVIGPEQRGQLMAHAKALFAPTIYVEPFGNVVVEAMACGTPAITTDWGAFCETVVDGKTGFRCRTLSEFIDAMTKVETLDSMMIREHAQANYSLEATAPKYDAYFRRLLTLWGDGWYELPIRKA